MAFRNDKIICVSLFILLLCIAQSALAISWKNLWLRPDQQAARLLHQGNDRQAAKIFENPNWQGVANYRSGNYKHAISNFSQNKSADNYYNRGNALAHLGEYKTAIAAYDQSLQLNPNDADAKFNRELLKKLLKQQQKQQAKSSKQKNQRQQQKQGQKQQPNQGQQQANKKQDQQQRQQNPAQQQKQTQQQSADKSQQKQQASAKTAQARPQSIQKQEQQQAQKQWLRRIPDDPGGLLRQKFLRDYMRMQRERVSTSG